MSREARKHWRKFADIFTRCGVLTEADLVALQKLCFELAELEKLQEQVQRTGYLLKNKRTGTYSINPLFKAMMELSQQVDRALRQFGATPASRPGIEASPTPPQGDPLIAKIVQ